MRDDRIPHLAGTIADDWGRRSRDRDRTGRVWKDEQAAAGSSHYLSGTTMRVRSFCLSLAALTLASAGVLTGPAEAATYTASGVRCTITGTSGDDTLVGTPQRDVICGRGGDDTIRARGGNDLVDGGGGGDLIVAGDGQDRVLAGAGADDVISGDGNDVVLGGDGADEVAAGSGGDTVSGGGGGDTIDGGAGADELAGQTGNDDLTGGRGADDINGGAGTNWCTVGSQDVQTRCVYDREAPRPGPVELSRTVVDVTDSDQRVKVRIRLTDDTGVQDVHLGLDDNETGAIVNVGYADLVSGTVRDGWWEQEAVVRRWSLPGTFTVSAYGRDRVGRTFDRQYVDALVVRDSNPDRNLPRVTLLRPTTSAVYDVREASRRVVVEARITDDVSGVEPHVMVCLWRPAEDHYTNLACPNAELVEGGLKNGVWRAGITIPQGATGGDWNVEVAATDRAHPHGHVRWMGPDVYRHWTDGGANPDPSLAAFADGMGRFSVRGSVDSTPARVASATIAPREVDTLAQGATVKVSVRATDAAGEGVMAVSAALGSGSADGEGPQWPPVDLERVSGTKVDGTWTGTFHLPQGTPPGTYYLSVAVEDARHWREYFSPDHPYTEGDGTIPGDSTVVVVQNPAG